MTEPLSIPQEEIRRLGIVAGQGDFPILMARAARGAGVEVVVIGIRGMANPGLEAIANEMHWVELGQVQHTIELLRAANVRHVALVGKVPHLSILQYRHFDLRAMKLLARAVNRKADTLLQTITDELAQEGIQVVDSSLFLRGLMPEAGLLTPRRPPSERETQDIEFGYPIAKAIAGQDVGQTIVVKEKMVVAVEAAEGTDECIRRAASLAGAGCVVVKVSKPNQDFRFDIPVIGRQTIATMAECGCSALAVSAKECLIFDKDEVLREAERQNIAIIAR
ncbi:MAG: hypothetical protein KatS3mg130_0979 [Candidatus Sumerlaea sp.]|uniref:UDP-2,3-diacylglucosamine pyrophosphatase n=1 Tax=Sumerlaea chitinivorans TaxID=2250252 RepID=A0A2Z4Y4W7_SUMC1|nr:UDP-2,3-diacylglucosamine pyrophosphatase [Candidatus Sumerlaea chitinivorans]GIX44571.1 MAG: hypothetical protein KatS3mg130_0979 [Candidatus Sumerlaea sp.]